MAKFPFVEYAQKAYPGEEMLVRSKSFYAFMNERRTVREFADRAVSKEVMENILLAASTAPSGANKQPWTFCLVSNAAIKKQIRIEAEKEELESYSSRMSEEWLEDLAPLQTDWKKPFLEIAPWLIVVFKRAYEEVNGKRRQNYYVQESVGIACGIMIAAVHNAGLCALTHTPSPMTFLTKVLNRPENERPFLLIPVGYAANNVMVPDLKRKSLKDIVVNYE